MTYIPLEENIQLRGTSCHFSSLLQTMLWIPVLALAQHEVLYIISIHRTRLLGNPPLTALQCCPIKKDADFSGAEVVPSSSTWGTDEGKGFGSV